MKAEPIFRPVHDATTARDLRSGVTKNAAAGKATDLFSYATATGKSFRFKIDLAAAFGRAIKHDRKLLARTTAQSKDAIEAAGDGIQEASDQYDAARRNTNWEIASLSHRASISYVDHAVESTQLMNDVLDDFHSGIRHATSRFNKVRFVTAAVIEAVDPDTLSKPLKSLHRKFLLVGKVLLEDTRTLHAAWDETKRWRRDFVALGHALSAPPPPQSDDGDDVEEPTTPRYRVKLPFTGEGTRRTLLFDNAEAAHHMVKLTNAWQDTIEEHLTTLHKPRVKAFSAPPPTLNKPLRTQISDARGHVMELNHRIGKRRTATRFAVNETAKK
jgi:hypothetical protein